MSIHASEMTEILKIGPLELMPEERLGRVNGTTLMLSMIELRMLTELARRADRIVSREELFRIVWERGFRPGERSIDVYVHRLRVKLEEHCRGGSSFTRTSASAIG